MREIACPRASERPSRTGTFATFPAVPGAKITLKEAQAIAYLLEHGRWPDAETASWMEERTSGVALDYLLGTRLRRAIAAVEEHRSKQ